MIHLVPSYFPSIMYYFLVVNSNVTYNLSTKYQKQTIRNRCLILSSNGPLKLIVPVKHNKKNNKSLFDYNAEVDNTQNWKVKHWKSIQNAYRSSPFFEFYEDDFYQVFFENENLLCFLNINIISHINHILGLKKKIKISTKKVTHENYNKKYLNIKKNLSHNIPKYNQVYNSKFKFVPNLSILDLLFNMGPKSIDYLFNLKFSQTHNK